VPVGLVLGAGGVSGAAYLAGALSVLEVDLGWDARDADTIVGTSAGALVGALIRAGFSASDVAALSVGAHGVADHPELRAERVTRPTLPPFSPWSLVGRPRVPPVRQWVTRPIGVRPRHLVAGLVRDGSLTLGPRLAPLRELLPEWPDAPLHLCAARYDSLRRHVFGPEHRDSVAPADAVAASCAVPGIFAPVAIDGGRYVDGGVHSPTNADVLAGRDDLDAVVVVSPLTAPGAFPSVRWAVRRTARGILTRELAALPPAVPVLVLEPPATVGTHLALDPVDDESVVDVMREAFLAAPTWLHDARATEVVDVLRADVRTRRRASVAPRVGGGSRPPVSPPLPQEEVA
jgi:NTE family protein